MNKIKVDCEQPVDIILETDEHIVLGCYKYGEERTGKIMFLNKDTKYLEYEYTTSGTLCIATNSRYSNTDTKYSNLNSADINNNIEDVLNEAISNIGTLYCANSTSISIYSKHGCLKEVKTDYLNTYIYCGTYVYVSNTNGEVVIYDYKLNHIRTVKVSKDTVWVVKEIDITKNINSAKLNNEINYTNILTKITEGNISTVLNAQSLNAINKGNENFSLEQVYLLIGDEEGWAHRYNIYTEEIVKIGKRREGIIDFLCIGDYVYISSYGGNVEIYNKYNLELQNLFNGVGSLWKMIIIDNLIYCASMYDGLNIFNKEFDIIDKIETQSICYGLCIIKKTSGVEIYWSSFYENCIYYTFRAY